jgi:hypothetical protein
MKMAKQLVPTTQTYYIIHNLFEHEMKDNIRYLKVFCKKNLRGPLNIRFWDPPVIPAKAGPRL